MPILPILYVCKKPDCDCMISHKGKIDAKAEEGTFKARSQRESMHSNQCRIHIDAQNRVQEPFTCDNIGYYILLQKI